MSTPREFTAGQMMYGRYHKQNISGFVLTVEEKHIVIVLYTPYQGKNEFWDVGERKVLFKRLIKGVRLKYTLKPKA